MKRKIAGLALMIAPTCVAGFILHGWEAVAVILGFVVILGAMIFGVLLASEG